MFLIIMVTGHKVKFKLIFKRNYSYQSLKTSFWNNLEIFLSPTQIYFKHQLSGKLQQLHLYLTSFVLSENQFSQFKQYRGNRSSYSSKHTCFIWGSPDVY